MMGCLYEWIFIWRNYAFHTYGGGFANHSWSECRGLAKGGVDGGGIRQCVTRGSLYGQFVVVMLPCQIWNFELYQIGLKENLETNSYHSFIKFYPKINLCQDTTIATICPTTADTRPTLASFRRSSSNFHWRRVLAGLDVLRVCELRSLDVSVCRSKFCVVFVCDRERARLVCAVI